MNKKPIASHIIFQFNPVIGVLYSLLHFVQYEKTVIFITSLFMGVCAYNLTPYVSMDLATHYGTFKALTDSSYGTIISNQKNVLLYLIMKFFSSNNINKEWIPFVFSFVAYYLSLSAFFSLFKTEKLWFKIFSLLMLMTTLSFLAIANGLRNGVSVAFFIYSFNCFYQKQNIKFVIFSLFAILMHSFTIPLVILTLTIRLLNKISIRKLKTILLIFVFVSFFINVLDFASFFVGKLSFISTVDDINRTYITGSTWGSAAEFTDTGLLVKNINSLPFYISLLVLISSKEKNVFYTASIFITSIAIILNSFWVISERYQYVASLLTLYYLYSSLEDEIKRSKYILLTLFFTCTLILTVVTLYKYRFMIPDSIGFIIFPFITCFMKTISPNDYIRIF